MINNKLIKVCGMKDGQNIHETELLGVDMIGLIFYPESPRYVRKKPDYLPKHALRVGVFVNEDIEKVKKSAVRFKLDFIQLHGSESPEYCHSLRSEGLQVIKAFSIAKTRGLLKTHLYETSCRYFLFDTPCTQYGGSGNTFDWNILHIYNGKTPFLLSGGITPFSAQRLQEFHHPRLAGYDLNSRFELEPGMKNIEQLQMFINDLHKKQTI